MNFHLVVTLGDIIALTLFSFVLLGFAIMWAGVWWQNRKYRRGVRY